MIKMHGTGNTFFIVEDLKVDYRLFTQELCGNHTDGVLFVEPSETALRKMRIFNRDGSEPEMCGNGLRCFARHILEQENLITATIETLKASYEVRYLKNFYGMIGVEIYLKPVYHFSSDELIDFNEKAHVKGNFYTVSNPHVVIEMDNAISDEDLSELGILGNKTFKEGVNVNIYRIIEKHKIYVRTYERGVGITKSCGTGMTSSTVDYAIKNSAFNVPIEVYNDGGMILCRVVKEDEGFGVYFAGNATYLENNDHDVKEEQIIYDNFLKETQSFLKQLN
ncbi:MAG: diaminopimelate epimerase [Clostridia bacterium]|nr:diaminopimelate epimerase [Clostridia bacterium]